MTLLVTGYDSKKALKECIGQPLRFHETSMFGEEYRADGKLTVAHRPVMGIRSTGREFFAEVTMKNGLIEKVT